MMDEQLIDEVAQHSVIFNRQKYYLNGNGTTSTMGKYETKDEAWQIISLKLRSDVETCKKRWKYLRERYVSQRKQGDPPVYEHLSRPYLEKMKFLDQHIQPRKSYRNVPNFLTSPHSANSSYNGDYNMDTKSNSSLKSLNHYGNNHHYAQDGATTSNMSSLENTNGHVKIEADQMFRDFAAAVANQQMQQAAAVAAAIADSSQNYNNNTPNTNGVITASSNSSLKSPLSSPLDTANAQNNIATTTTQSGGAQVNTTSMNAYGEVQGDELDSSTGSNFNMKKPRVQLQTTSHNGHNNSNVQFGTTDTDEDSDSSSLLQPQTLLQESSTTNSQSNNYSSSTIPRNLNNNNQNQNMIPANADFLFQLYQQLPQQQQQQQQQQPPQQNHQQQTNSQQTQQQQQSPHYKFPIQNGPERSSEQLLGELVTTELLKMTKERRKNVQKRILEILFFDD